MSKDATIEAITNVETHPNADKLDIVTVLGYKCVVPKGQYEPDDLVVYIRSDSVLPDDTWAIPYKQYALNRVRIIKLRGEYSEGIVMPIKNMYDAVGHGDVTIGEDVSEILNIIHYEPRLTQSLDAKGGLPYLIPKTDEERWENMVKMLPIGETCDITLKIDGQSATYFYKLGDENVGICSRSLELKPEYNNNYTTIYNKYDIGNKLKQFCIDRNISLAIRGEIYGGNVQAFKHNPHAFKPLDFAMYSVYLIDERRYARYGEENYFLNVAVVLDIPTVPFVEPDVDLTEDKIKQYSTELEKVNDCMFEGVVVQYPYGSFKIINKYYDSKK